MPETPRKGAVGVDLTTTDLSFLIAVLTNARTSASNAGIRRDLTGRLTAARDALVAREVSDQARDYYQDALVQIATTPNLTAMAAKELAAAAVRGEGMIADT